MNTAHTPTQVTLFVYYKLPLPEHAQWVGRVQLVLAYWRSMQNS